MHVLATAGHVDHGKSTLVKALTGIDPDRLAEEKARGLTIDLGFAWTSLPSGRGLSFVDVPGHVRFLRNMLAGVGAVDSCLFVVAATEGWKPQSEEHLRILDLLGLETGVIALTKTALVDDDLIELATLEIDDHVRGTFLEGAPVVAVDALDGTGLDNLLSQLDEVLADVPTAVDRGRPRLWIDRSFASRGAGTVVTGTLTGGRVRVDDELDLLPAATSVRVRAIQSRKEERTKVGPGNRVALNLTGTSHTDVARGDALVVAEQWRPTRMFDASLTVLDSIERPVSRRGAYVAYIGSGAYPVRLRVLGPEALMPGETGAARIHLRDDLPLLPGDRFILRDDGPGETVGGGAVLEVAPTRRASQARPSANPDRVIADRGWIDTTEFERLTGERREPVLGEWLVDPDTLGEAEADLRQAIGSAAGLGLDLATLDDRDRSILEILDGIVVEGGRVRFASSTDPLNDHPFVRAAQDALFSPPDADGYDRGELRELVRRGLLLDLEGRFFAASVVEQSRRVVSELLAANPDGFTVSQFRQAAGNTRKHAVPLLGHLDANGITRRRDDLRIAGPRL